MNQFNEHFKRASLQSLRAYFLNGVEDEVYSTESHEARIKKAYKNWHDVIEEFDQKGENSKLYNTISESITEYENVYMELGIQTGFKLAKDIDKYSESTESTRLYEKMYFTLFNDITHIIKSLQNIQQKAEEIYQCSEVKGQGIAETP